MCRKLEREVLARAPLPEPRPRRVDVLNENVVLRVHLRGMAEMVHHAVEIAAGLGNAGEIIVGKAGQWIAQIERAAYVPLGGLEISGVVIGACEIEVRGVVIAEALEDGSELGNPLPVNAPEAAV